MSFDNTAASDRRVRPRTRNLFNGLALFGLTQSPMISDAVANSIPIASGYEDFAFVGEARIKQPMVMEVTSGTGHLIQLSPHFPTSDAITGQTSFEVNIRVALDTLFRIAEEENFQDGCDSNFSVGVSALLMRYPAETMEAIEEVVSTNKLPLDVLCELLYTLGRSVSELTKDDRLGFLVEMLSGKLHLLRDAAGTALAYMDDPRAIPYLKEAIASEKRKTLRADLQLVLEQLEK